MAKIYQQPERKQELEKDKPSQKTVGVYQRPERTGPSRELMIVIAVIVAILVVFLLYRLARGEEQVSRSRSVELASHLSQRTAALRFFGTSPMIAPPLSMDGAR